MDCTLTPLLHGKNARTDRGLSFLPLALTAAALLCLAPAPSRGEGTPLVSVTTAARFGAFYGQANELVYNQALSADYKNSELVWPLTPLFFTGEALSIDSVIGIFATLDVRQGFAGTVGTMTDSDFLNGDGQRTHYSQSSSYAERANLLDLQVGWDFFRSGALKIGAFGAFSYMDLKWSARDGYYQYPASGSPYTTSPFTPGKYTPWNASETKTPLCGTGIIYETAYFAGAVGLRTRYALGGGFSVDASFAFTPLALCTTEDNHVLRQVDFYSTLTGGLMIEPRAALEYSPLAGATLRLEIGYRYAWNFKGDLTQVNTGTSDFSTSYPSVAGPNSTYKGTNDSGAALSVLDAGLSLRISL